ncbi:hypothetical protein [Lederbergia citrea]|uniref:hypothetical protein n=1 Tax=Lederbergia citrea TaxID=2833581 RepID=UPI001BCA17AA|nr:hypothetical protein [Lederbergia citrea]MBS4176989.1 hypothetical protein [Lederbergia citrea]MBS4203563.1 hypothetical protein [Lederbergia citrea]
MTKKPYGKHWKGIKGYRVIEGNDEYNHYFGGQDCDLPVCKLCAEKMHLIFCFDLKDVRLSEIKAEELNILPLVSCLNCSMVWEPQYFQLSNGGKFIQVISQENTKDWLQDEEDRLPVRLPKANVKLIEMKAEDTPINEDNYDTAFDLFGSEYLCRLLGAPFYDEFPEDLECPICNQEMKYIATATQDPGERSLISVVDFQLGEMIIFFHLCKDCLVIKSHI